MTFLKKYKKGFSLIELLVVMAIFVVMTTIVLARQNKYSSDSEINNLAYKMALAIRQAQVYGLSVKGDINTDLANPNFNVGYGIHFDSDQTGKSHFLLFADQGDSRDYIYNPQSSGSDSTPLETPLTTYDLNKGIIIKDFCVDDGAGGNLQCESLNLTTVTNLDLVFTRPDPKASIIFYAGNTGEPTDQITNVEDAKRGRAIISIESPLADKKTKCIIITKAGQISVDDPIKNVGDTNNPFTCK